MRRLLFFATVILALLITALATYGFVRTTSCRHARR
jgi:hypothetical protein